MLILQSAQERLNNMATIPAIVDKKAIEKGDTEDE
jgi:hypothetical protein